MSTVSFGFPEGTALLVTGAGSGIGRATALHGARMGLRVSAWDLNPEGLAQTAAAIADLGGTVHSWVADVGDYSQITTGLAAAIDELGPITLLHNNAGPPSSAALGFDEAVQLSIGSMRAMTDAWVQTSPGEGAAMVITSSVAGNLIGTDSPWYSAAKAGVAGYARHLAAYRAGEFRTNVIAPGMTDTPRLAGFRESDVGQRVLDRIPLGRMASADDIAFATLFLLSPLAGYINGAYLPVDGGWTVTQ